VPTRTLDRFGIRALRRLFGSDLSPVIDISKGAACRRSSIPSIRRGRALGTLVFVYRLVLQCTSYSHEFTSVADFPKYPKRRPP
jgi:hypothetical protein